MTYLSILTRKYLPLLVCFALFATSFYSQSSGRKKNVNPNREQGKYLTNRDGTKTYYLVRGAKTGTPLFVLHGGPGFDHQYFLSNKVFDEIGKHRPVIFYDQRGGGKSSKIDTKEGIDFMTLIYDIEDLKKHLGYEKIDLAGHSWGGFLAMAYAALGPNEISHLILIDSPPPFFFKTSDYFDLRKHYPKEFDNMIYLETKSKMKGDQKALRESVVTYMKMLFYSDKNRDGFIAGSKNYTYDPKSRDAISGSALRLNLEKSLKKTSIPTLIIHGRHDVNLNPKVATDEIAPAIPKSKIVIFEESGHLPFYEEPKKFVREVNNFLSDK